MKILILGSHGFIGSHLCDFFINENEEVVGCDIVTAGNTLYPYYQLSVSSADLENVFAAHEFDVCINASGAANVYHSVLYPLSDFEANVFSVAKILDTIRKQQPACKYIQLSSAAVYGNPETLPVKESAGLDPVSPYGFHKLMSEMICREYHALFDLKIAIIRPFSVYGNGLKKQILWDICSKLKKDDTVTLFGTGNETRDFIHISDFVLLTDLVIRKCSFNCEIFNAASGKQISVRSLAQLFETGYGVNKKIIFNGDVKPGDPLYWEADLSAVAKLGFNATADFSNAVYDYINWFNREHGNS